MRDEPRRVKPNGHFGAVAILTVSVLVSMSAAGCAGHPAAAYREVTAPGFDVALSLLLPVPKEASCGSVAAVRLWAEKGGAAQSSASGTASQVVDLRKTVGYTRYSIDDTELIPSPVYISVHWRNPSNGFETMGGKGDVAIVGKPREDNSAVDDGQAEGADEKGETHDVAAPLNTLYPPPDESGEDGAAPAGPTEVNPTASRLNPEAVPPLPQGEAFQLLVGATCEDGARQTRPMASTALTQAGRVTGVSIVGTDVEKLLDLLDGFVPDTKGGWASVPPGYETIEAPLLVLPGTTVD